MWECLQDVPDAVPVNPQLGDLAPLHNLSRFRKFLRRVVTKRGASRRARVNAQTGNDEAMAGGRRLLSNLDPHWAAGFSVIAVRSDFVHADYNDGAAAQPDLSICPCLRCGLCRGVAGQRQLWLVSVLRAGATRLVLPKDAQLGDIHGADRRTATHHLRL